MPDKTTEIISGGAKSIDTLAEQYADKNGISKTIIKPECEKYRRNAPLIRNKEVVEKSDFIVALWDGKSRGTEAALCFAPDKIKLNLPNFDYAHKIKEKYV